MIKPTRRFIHTRSRFALLVTAACSITACGPSDKAGRQPLNAVVPQTGTPTEANTSATTLPSGAVAALDAGNGAYRSKDYATALKKYREAAAIAPAHAAPWFGLYMVASELKNVSLADSAMVRVKLLSADPAALGAHAEVAASDEKQGAPASAMPSAAPLGTALPPGHPTTQQLPPGHPTPGKIQTAKPPVQRKSGTL